jgi:hypothetical protein
MIKKFPEQFEMPLSVLKHDASRYRLFRVNMELSIEVR